MSIHDWEPRLDGCVTIKQIACVRFKRDPDYKNSQLLVAPEVAKKSSLSYDTPYVQRFDKSISEWLADFYPSTPNYAICLSYSALHAEPHIGCQYIGLILKQVGDDNGTTILVKIGTFIAAGPPYSYIEKKRVDWLVL